MLAGWLSLFLTRWRLADVGRLVHWCRWAYSGACMPSKLKYSRILLVRQTVSTVFCLHAELVWSCSVVLTVISVQHRCIHL